MIEDVECPYCFGAGQWPEGAGYVTCHKCRGEGTFPVDHKIEIEDWMDDSSNPFEGICDE